jgi:hypothetical protein
MGCFSIMVGAAEPRVLEMEGHRVGMKHQIGAALGIVVDQRRTAAAGVFGKQKSRVRMKCSPSRVWNSSVPLRVMTSCLTGAVCQSNVPPDAVS